MVEFQLIENLCQSAMRLTAQVGPAKTFYVVVLSSLVFLVFIFMMAVFYVFICILYIQL